MKNAKLTKEQRQAMMADVRAHRWPLAKAKGQPALLLQQDDGRLICLASRRAYIPDAQADLERFQRAIED